MANKGSKKGVSQPQTQEVKYLQNVDKSIGKLYQNTANLIQGNGANQYYDSAQKSAQQQINRQYNDNARGYYQMYKQNQARLGENLSRLGVTGGASETATTNLLNNYGTNIYNNQSARSNALTGVQTQYDQLRAQNSINIANRLADIYYNLGSGLLAEQRQNKREDFLRKQQYAREDASVNYDRALAQAQYTGDFSVMSGFGWSESDIKKANKLFADSNNSSGGGGSSGGGRRGGYRYSYGGSSGGSDLSGIESPITTGSDIATTAARSVLNSANKLLSSLGGSSKNGNSKSSGGGKGKAVITQANKLLNTLKSTSTTDAQRSNTAKQLGRLLSTKGGQMTPEQYNKYWAQYQQYRKPQKAKQSGGSGSNGKRTKQTK